MSPNWLEYWYDALASEFGIVVQVSDPDSAKQALYRARASSGDPALEGLTIKTSPFAPSSELWIMPLTSSKRNETP